MSVRIPLDKPSDVLEASANMLSIPGCWTKDAAAKDAKGNAVIPTSPQAVCWCLTGSWDRLKAALASRISTLFSARIGRDPISLNDNAPNAEIVVSACRDAAAYARSIGE